MKRLEGNTMMNKDVENVMFHRRTKKNWDFFLRKGGLRERVQGIFSPTEDFIEEEWSHID